MKNITSPFAVRVFKDNQFLREIRLDPELTYIGRMAENHVVLDDPKVSRSHARIKCNQGQFILEDQHSENGIYVNGQRVNQHILLLGDKITLGRHSLEVVHAKDHIKPEEPEAHMDQEGLDEWRSDQTISFSREDLQAKHLARIAQKETKENKPPVMNLKLTVGEKEFSKQVVFDRGKRGEEGEKENSIEITLRLGKWILEKKIPL